jgi:hypothetical protein
MKGREEKKKLHLACTHKERAFYSFAHRPDSHLFTSLIHNQGQYASSMTTHRYFLHRRLLVPHGFFYEHQQLSCTQHRQTKLRMKRGHMWQECIVARIMVTAFTFPKKSIVAKATGIVTRLFSFLLFDDIRFAWMTDRR